jgi:hypothetical protein
MAKHTLYFGNGELRLRKDLWDSLIHKFIAFSVTELNNIGSNRVFFYGQKTPGIFSS